MVQFKQYLPQLEEILEPVSVLPTNTKQLYETATGKIKNTHTYLLGTLMIG